MLYGAALLRISARTPPFVILTRFHDATLLFSDASIRHCSEVISVSAKLTVSSEHQSAKQKSEFVITIIIVQAPMTHKMIIVVLFETDTQYCLNIA